MCKEARKVLAGPANGKARSQFEPMGKLGALIMSAYLRHATRGDKIFNQDFEIMDLEHIRNVVLKLFN